MAGFGAKEEKTLSADPKQIPTDEARKPVEQAKKPTGLLTPESTPGPDTARLEADKARREAEAKASNEVNPGKPSAPDTAGVMANKEKGPEKMPEMALPADQSQGGASDKGQKGYTDEQKNAVKRVLKCGPNQYYQILGLKDPSTKEESRKAYKQLALLVHPDKNKYEDAEEAFKRRQNSVVTFKAIRDPSLLFWFDARLTS
jgi:hypothetical protein